MSKLSKIGMATVLGGVVFALATGCSSPVTPIPDEEPDTDPPEDDPLGYVATEAPVFALGGEYVISDVDTPLG